MKFVPYHPDHFIEIAKEMENINADAGIAVSAKTHSYFPASTVMDDNDNPLACYGATPVCEGVGSLWAIFSEEMKQKKRMQLYRYTRDFINNLIEKEYHRLECTVIVGDEKKTNFIEKFKFVREAQMRKASFDERDLYLYARVRED